MITLRRIAELLSGIALIASLAGCTFHYDITLQNGDVIRAMHKPKLNSDGNYVFKDMNGHERVLSPMRIREIAPAERKDESKSFYQSR